MRHINEEKSALYTELANTYNIGLGAPDKTIFSMPLIELSVSDNMRRLIEAHMPLIKTTAPDASAMSVTHGVSHLAFVQQYAMSVYEVSIDLSLDNLELHLYRKDGYVAFGYTLKQWGERPLPEAESERAARRHDVLRAVYRETVGPLIEAASRTADIHARELWGQFPANLRYYVGTWRDAAESERVRCRIDDDYRFLREGFEPADLGAMVNPYRAEPILTKDLRQPGVMIPLKNTCCLYYKWEDGGYCFACPRIKESEREARREAYRTAAPSGE